MSEQTPGTSGESGISERFGVGTQIAGYRLEERIGLGGMAVVFRAHDRRLDRQVALKILAPALAADDAFQQRFIRESRAAAAVDDPHIIPVFEAGEADGVLFIAMRYVRGGDVRSLIDRIGPLPAARAAEIISQAASALDAAHARGLVHRDVKPANMLLEASSAADRPEHLYLSDFGLSKAALSTADLTATGQFLGTLDYVAPEQIESRPLDGRTDEYGLACSAFEMLCGEPPFRGTGGLSVMYAHLSDPPPSVRLLRPELAAEADAVMAKALAKAPDDRYASCREFAADLRAALVPAASGQERPAGVHPATQIAGPPDRAQPARPATELAQAAPPGERAPQYSGDRTDPGQPVPGATSVWTRPARPWWRSPAPVAGICAVALVAIGAIVLAGHGHGGPASTAPPAASLATVTMPGCSTAIAKARSLTGISTVSTDVGGSPFGIAVTPDGRYSFVSGDDSVLVLRNSAGLAPEIVRTISVPGADKGDTLTANGQFLLAATKSGAAIINVAEAVDGAPDPVFGTLASPQGSGATEVLITADEHYALVSLGNSTQVAVYDLRRALAQGTSPADFIGDIPVPSDPTGLATDGTWLYVASLKGFLTVASMAKAESQPAKAVVTSTAVGCQPARALLSPDHQVLWVTDRGADYLLAFSTVRLRSTPRAALIAKIMVGEAPIGEAFVDGGSRIVVADSNLNKLTGRSSSVAVVATADALRGKPALLGYLPTGRLAHQFAVEPGGRTLLVTLQSARQLEAITIADLP